MLFNDTQLITALKEAKVVVMPTDTVYGLCGIANNQMAVAQLYSLKNREKKPGTVIASSIEQLVELGFKKRYLTAVEHLWPNPLSIVIPTGLSLSYLDLGVGSIAVRITADEELQKLLEKTGPLLSSSANLPGLEPSTTITEAKRYFGNSVDLYVDGGDRSNSQPSTVIRVVDDVIEVLRKGALNINEKGEIL